LLQTPIRAGSPPAADVRAEDQLFLDRFWLEAGRCIEFPLPVPVPRDVAIQRDRPWEKALQRYSKVVRDDGSYRMCSYRTSGGGALRVEIQDAGGKPLPGRSLDGCDEIFGDRIEGTVRWRAGEDLSRWAGSAVRLRVRLRDAELFAFRFPGD
jgi:hypothetical protein